MRRGKTSSVRDPIAIIAKEAKYEILPDFLHNTIAVGILRNNYPESLYPTSFSLYSTGSAILYWGILYSSLGLIPLFYRRHLLIALPWLYESILVVPQYATIQDQYSFIAMPALFIGLILSINRGNRQPLSFARMLKTAGYTLITCLPAVIIYEFTSQYASYYRVFFAVLAAIVALAIIIFISRVPNIRHYMHNMKKSAAYAIAAVIVLIIVFNFLLIPMMC